MPFLKNHYNSDVQGGSFCDLYQSLASCTDNAKPKINGINNLKLIFLSLLNSLIFPKLGLPQISRNALLIILNQYGIKDTLPPTPLESPKVYKLERETSKMTHCLMAGTYRTTAKISLSPPGTQTPPFYKTTRQRSRGPGLLLRRPRLSPTAFVLSKTIASSTIRFTGRKARKGELQLMICLTLSSSHWKLSGLFNRWAKSGIWFSCNTNLFPPRDPVVGTQLTGAKLGREAWLDGYKCISIWSLFRAS